MDSNQPCCIGPASSTLCVPESFLIVRPVRCFPRLRHNAVAQCRLNGMSLTPLNPKQIAGGDYARTVHHRLHLTSAWTIRTRVRVVQYLNVAASGLLLSPHRRQPHMHHALLRRQLRTSHLHLVELMHRWYDMFVVVRWQRRWQHLPPLALSHWLNLSCRTGMPGRPHRPWQHWLQPGSTSTTRRSVMRSLRFLTYQ